MEQGEVRSRTENAQLTVEATLRGLDAIIAGDVPVDELATVYQNLKRAQKQVLRALLARPKQG